MDLNRETAFLVIRAVEENKAYSNIELNNRIREKRPDHPAFVRQLAYGVLERKYTLDHYLGQLLKKGTAGLDKRALIILRMGLYQIMYMENVPDHGAVSESVNLARKHCKSLSGLINGVLRNYLRRKPELKGPETIDDLPDRLSAEYSIEKQIVELLLSQYEEDTVVSILASYLKKPPLSVRVNLLKTDPDSLREELEREGWAVIPSEISERALRVQGMEIEESESFRKGWFSFQDESSIAMIDEVSPGPGSRVIDVCAAPGGKSFAAAELMENKGSVTGFDKYENKVKSMTERSRRLGIKIFDAGVMDSAIGDEKLNDTADLVICDVPCSGLGVIRRRPEIKYRPVKDESAELKELQKRILLRSKDYVRKGGRLVYSTCTINREENQDMTGTFLEENRDFNKIGERLFLPGKDDTDGFYYCIMEKI